MMCCSSQPVALSLLFLSLLLTPFLAKASQPFSATVVQTGPSGNIILGQLFVSDGIMRIEHKRSTEALISLIDYRNSKIISILPEKHIYTTQNGMQWLPLWLEFVYMNRDPNCNMLPKGSCVFHRDTHYSGRPVSRWTIKKPVFIRQQQWIDKEHGFVVKSQSHSGGLMELRLTGHDTVEGRVVEKWRRSNSFRDEAPTISYQWYDPRLKLVVKEELPGGYVRKLNGLRIGDQPEKLFQVPQGYRSAKLPGDNPVSN